MLIDYIKKRFCSHNWEMMAFVRRQYTEYKCSECGRMRVEAWRVTYPDEIKKAQLLKRRDTDK